MNRTDAIVAWASGPDILDIGCTDHVVEPGSAHWVHRRLVQHHPATIGIDVDHENVKRVAELGYPVIVADGQRFALNKRFDTVVAGDVIEHVDDPARLLRSCAEHLKPGGKIVLTTPYPFCLQHQLYALISYPRTCLNEEHAVWFCPQTFTELARRSSLRVVHQDLVDYYRSDFGTWRNRIFVRLLRALSPVLPKRLRSNTMLFVLERDLASASEHSPVDVR